MRTVTLKGLLGRKFRSLMTAFAIVLGVAMVSGSFILTDTIDNGFDSVYATSYDGVDLVITSKPAVDDGPVPTEGPPLPAKTVNTVETVDGVAAAAGAIEDEVTLVDSGGTSIGTGLAFGIDTAAGARLNPLELIGGRWPRGAHEVAIDASTASGHGFRIGGTIEAAADGPVRRYEITGIVRFGAVDSIGGSAIVAFDLGTAQQVFDKRGRLDVIRVLARDGVRAGELVRPIRAVVPPTARVQTAVAQAAADSEDTQADLSFLRSFLLAFGGIALFVGAFVVANTLSITVAQRLRELATLRTLGASRKQVLRSVVLESLLVGLGASVVGLLLGLGLAQGLEWLLAQAGIELPNNGVVFATRTVVLSLLVGVGITLLASLRPALRATRVAPIAAVREGAAMPPSRLAHYGLATAGALVVVGGGLVAAGAFAPMSTAGRLLAFAAGALVLFVGITLAAPRLVGPLAALVGAPGARLAGVAGTLARDNAARNASRTASTAGALMVGLALVTVVSIVAAGFQSGFVGSVEKLFVADYALVADGDSGASDEAAEVVAGVDGVTTISAIKSGSGRVFGESITVNGVDASLTDVVALEWERPAALQPRLAPGRAFVKDKYAHEHALTQGSDLRLKTPSGDVLELTVAGVFVEPTGGSPLGDVAIGAASFARFFPNAANAFTFANVRGGPSPETTRRLDDALAPFPDVEPQTRDEFKDAQLAQLETILNLIYALLGLSIIVSVFGIVNTLVLSVFERTRELGMLRAIGMTRRQTRRMIRHESIITALIGATLGIGVGIFLAVLVAQALPAGFLVFTVPYASLAVFVAAAVAAGIVAAVMPARRASNLNVLEALHHE